MKNNKKTILLLSTLILLSAQVVSAAPNQEEVNTLALELQSQQSLINFDNNIVDNGINEPFLKNDSTSGDLLASSIAENDVGYFNDLGEWILNGVHTGVYCSCGNIPDVP